MRLNQFLSRHTDLSRRKADDAISEGRIEINGVLAKLGDTVIDTDKVSLDGHLIEPVQKTETILLHKPVGYVCSRKGQGSKTIYEVIPAELHHLNPIGRLDKDSSGLLLMTNDGDLANMLTHPRYQKEKRYIATLDRPLRPADSQQISGPGVRLDDGPSRLGLTPISHDKLTWKISMTEGRNRQIRRTFKALGYTVEQLHRTDFGGFTLGNLPKGELRHV